MGYLTFAAFLVIGIAPIIGTFMLLKADKQKKILDKLNSL
jgi:hypothetical protein